MFLKVLAAKPTRKFISFERKRLDATGGSLQAGIGWQTKDLVRGRHQFDRFQRAGCDSGHDVLRH